MAEIKTTNDTENFILEISFKDDIAHWEKMSEDVKFYIKHMLAFFSSFSPRLM